MNAKQRQRRVRRKASALKALLRLLGSNDFLARNSDVLWGSFE